MRRLLMIHFLVIGFLIQVVAYFWLAAPWGFPPDTPAHADPNVHFAPVFYVAGILVMLLGVLVYELLPDRPDE